MRVNTVKSARATTKSRNCEACGQPITAGQAYNWIKPRYGMQRNRHASCAQWKPSEMTGSKMAIAMAGQEDAYEALDAIDADTYVTYDEDTGAYDYDTDGLESDIASALELAVTAAEDCRSEYEEGLDNMPEQLRDGDVGMQIQENMDNLEAFADTVESFRPDLGEMDDEMSWHDLVADAVEQARDVLGELMY